MKAATPLFDAGRAVTPSGWGDPRPLRLPAPLTLVLACRRYRCRISQRNPGGKAPQGSRSFAMQLEPSPLPPALHSRQLHSGVPVAPRAEVLHGSLLKVSCTQ